MAEIDQESKELRELLAKPASQVLDSARTLIIDAAGPLSSVPFNLIFRDHAGGLVRSFAFRDYLERRDSAPIAPRSRLLLFASPALSPDLAGSYRPLPISGDESETIRPLFRNVVLRQGTAANPVLLAADAPQAEVFHFLGHGAGNGGSSTLLLAPADVKRPYSGIVTAADIAGQRWRKCQLTVLAACSTDPREGSREFTGRSLVRAFLSAGARRVVASQWDVNSGATGMLMLEFYRAMLTGIAPADALARAADQIRRRAGMQHPYYWAAFQIFGYR